MDELPSYNSPGAFGQSELETYLRICAPKEDTNQPTHPCSLIRVFFVRMKKFCILCVNAQAGLNLRRVPMSEGTVSDVSAKLAYQVMLTIRGRLITPFVLGSMSVGLNILIRHSFMDL